MEHNRPSVTHVFSASLRRLRNTMGVSQEVLAERTGITQTYLSALERGQKFPAAKVIEAFAKVFNVEYEDLFVNLERPPVPQDEASEAFVSQLQTEARRLALEWLAKQRR